MFAIHSIWNLDWKRPGIDLSHVLAALLIFCAAFAQAEDSQFVFDATGNLTLQKREAGAPPQILAQPQTQVVVPGALASFVVVAANPHNLRYQWRFNGADIPGATNDTLLIQNVSAAEAGEYSVFLSNPSASLASASAALLLDGDRDSLPDSWEAAHFRNLGQGAAGDFDGDGISNLDEFLQGTDPADSLSGLFRLTVVSDGGQVTVNPSRFTFTNGEIVTLTATVFPPNTFHGWTGATNATSPTISLVMDSNKTILAHLGSYDITWTNSLSGDWNVRSNWSPNFVPGTNDNVVIQRSVTVTLNDDAEIGSLTLGGGATLAGSGALTLQRNSAWSGGTLAGAGRMILSSNATLTIDGNMVLTGGRVLDNAGTSIWNSGSIQVGTGTVITNRLGALFLVQSAAQVTVGLGGGRMDNAGTIRKTSAGTTAIENPVSLNNYGLVELENGTLSVGGGGMNSGMMELSAGATLNFAAGTFTSGPGSSITGAGQLAVSGGTANLAGLVHLTGNHTFSGGTANLTGHYICTNNTLTINAAANFNGTGTVSPATLNLGNNGNLGGGQAVTVLGQMNWTGGNMTGAGRTIIPPGATLTINASSTGLSGGRILDNGGTTLWNAGNIQAASNTVITNRPGALFLVQSAAQVTTGLGAGRIDNAGVFRKTSTGTTTINGPAAFHNYGTVEMVGGILAANGGYTSRPASLLQFSLGGTTAGTGYGRLQVSGTVTLNGSLGATFLNGFVPTTNDLFTVVTAGTRNGSFSSFIYPSNLVSMQISNSATAVALRVTGLVAESEIRFLPSELAGSDIKLKWTAVSNRTYRLEYKTDLNGTNWDVLPGDVTSVGTNAVKLDALTSSNRFYRVRVVP